MRVLAAQMNPTIGDFEGNVAKILSSLEYARGQGVDVVLFPEMGLCGYPPEDLLLHPSFVEAVPAYLERVIQASSGLFVVVGLVRRNVARGEKPLFNSAAILGDGKLLGYQDKILLPTYDVFDERRYFEPGEAMRPWEWKGKKIAVTICEDIWQHAGEVGYTHYAHDPVEELHGKGACLLVNISASPYHFEKPETRIRVCAQSAKTLKCPVIMCCQVGGNDQLVFDGYSLVTDARGELTQIAKGFREDRMLVDLQKSSSPLPFVYDSIGDLYQALVLGVRDYFHKLGFQKGCFGLSGGVDSALVACIAAEALGKENVLGVMMPSRYSSSGSISDAEALAKNLEIPVWKIPIEEPFSAFLDLLKPHFSGKKEDVTEENLQARIRGMILMAISNKLGHVVLSTGNKSEMALGYCTLYGDMCGGLAVISDVTKQQVYALSSWINRNKMVIPQETISKVPSAELRPNQKDTDSLPAYDLIDKVLQSYVEAHMSPEEIAQAFSLPLDFVTNLISRILRAEYKRRQAAPGIRVTRRSFSVGRRFPIVQKWM